MTEYGINTTDGVSSNDILYDFKTTIQEYIDAPKVFKNMFTRPHPRSISRIGERSMTFEEIGEGASPNHQHTKYRQYNITVKEYGVQTGITRNMVEDSSYDIVAYTLKEVIAAADRNVNSAIISVMQTGWWDGTQTLAPPPYGSNTFTTATTHMVTGGSTITFAKILEAKTLPKKMGYVCDYLMLHSTNESELLALADYTQVFGTSGSYNIPDGIFKENFEKSIIGRVYGMTVFSNDWVPENKAILVASSVKPCGFVDIRPLSIEEDNGKGIVNSFVTMRYGVEVVDRGAGSTLTIS